MRTRSWPCGALLCVLALAVSAPSRAAEPEPGLIIRVKSLDGLIEDAMYLAKAVGQEEKAKEIEKALLAQAGDKGLKGFDRTRPIGLYGTVGQFGIDSTVVAMIPVKDEDAVLGLLENLNVKAEKGDDGIYSVSGGQVPVFFRFANNYAYVTGLNKDALDKAKLAAPADVLPAHETAAVTVIARLDRIPEGIKKQAIDKMHDQIKEDQEKRKPNETEAQHALGVELGNETAQFIASVLQEGRTLEARLELDRAKKELVLQTSLDAVPDSKLATTLQHLGEQQSLFTGLAANHPALFVLGHLSLPQQSLKPLGEAIDDSIKQGLAKESDKTKREQAEKLARALVPTLKSGEFDGGVVLRGPSAGKTYTVVAGLKVKEGAALEKTLRQLIDDLPAEQRKAVHLDAAKAGEVSLHRIDVAEHLGEDAKKAFGPEAEAYVAFRADAVLFALGVDALAALKEAVALEHRPAPYVLVDLAMAHLAPLMEKENPGAVKAAAEAFKEPGQDRVYFVVKGGKTLQMTFRLNPAVLSFASQVDAAKKALKEKP
jgi:hypothetical protein